MPRSRRSVLLPLFAALALFQTGCWGDRPEPIPQHTVTVTPDLNRYLYDGQPMGLDQLQAELQALSDKNIRTGAGGGTARAYLTILTQPGAEYDRTIELINWCTSVGLDKIQTTGR